MNLQQSERMEEGVKWLTEARRDGKLFVWDGFAYVNCGMIVVSAHCMFPSTSSLIHAFCGGFLITAFRGVNRSSLKK